MIRIQSTDDKSPDLEQKEENTQDDGVEIIVGYNIYPSNLMDIFHYFSSVELPKLKVNDDKLVIKFTKTTITYNPKITIDDLNRILVSENSPKKLESYVDFTREYFNLIFDSMVMDMYKSQEYKSVSPYSFSQKPNSTTITFSI